MALFDFLFKRGGGSDKRRTTRRPGRGIRVRIDRAEYEVHDLSMNGFRLHPYAGDLIARQRFTFTFLLARDGEVHEVPGRGIVLRSDTDGLAAKFQRLQPYYRRVLADHIRAGSQR